MTFWQGLTRGFYLLTFAIIGCWGTVSILDHDWNMVIWQAILAGWVIAAYLNMRQAERWREAHDALANVTHHWMLVSFGLAEDDDAVDDERPQEPPPG